MRLSKINRSFSLLGLLFTFAPIHAAANVNIPVSGCERALTITEMLGQNAILKSVSPDLPEADCATQINALQILRREQGQNQFLNTQDIHWATVHLDQHFDPEYYGFAKSFDQLHLLGESLNAGSIVNAKMMRLAAARETSLRPGVEAVREFNLGHFDAEPKSICVLVGDVRDDQQRRISRKSLLLLGREGPNLLLHDPTRTDDRLLRLVLVDSQRRGGMNFLRFGNSENSMNEESFLWPLAITQIRLDAPGPKLRFLLKRPPAMTLREVPLTYFDAQFKADGLDYYVWLGSNDKFRLLIKDLESSPLKLVSAVDDGRALDIDFETTTILPLRDNNRPALKVEYQKHLGFHFPHGKQKGWVEEFYVDSKSGTPYGWPGWQNLNRRLADVSEFSVP